MADKSIEDLTDDADSELVTQAVAWCREGKRLTAAHKVARDNALIQDRLRKMSWARLAAKYHVDDRTTRKIWDAWAKADKPRRDQRADKDPTDVVYGMVDAYEAWIEQLADIADGSVEAGPKIAAINSQMTATHRMTELMQASGLMPRDLGTLRVEMDVRILAKRIVQVLNDHGVSQEVKGALLEALEHRN